MNRLICWPSFQFQSQPKECRFVWWMVANMFHEWMSICLMNGSQYVWWMNGNMCDECLSKCSMTESQYVWWTTVNVFNEWRSMCSQECQRVRRDVKVFVGMSNCSQGCQIICRNVPIGIRGNSQYIIYAKSISSEGRKRINERWAGAGGGSSLGIIARSLWLIYFPLPPGQGLNSGTGNLRKNPFGWSWGFASWWSFVTCWASPLVWPEKPNFAPLKWGFAPGTCIPRSCVHPRSRGVVTPGGFDF